MPSRSSSSSTFRPTRPAPSSTSATSSTRTAAGALAAAIGLPRDVDAVHFTRPADTAQRALAFEDAEKLAFALGCLSARAAALGQQALPDEPQAFKTLHLIRLLALDLASDGFLDGLERLVPARLDLGPGPVALEREPWRVGLVAGCAQWQGHPANRMALDRDEDVALNRLDNCPGTPNAAGGGTCTLGDSNLLGTPCTLSAECGSGGFCSTNQEDSNSNGVGDACEPTLLPEPGANGLLVGGLMLLWALAGSRHSLNA